QWRRFAQHPRLSRLSRRRLHGHGATHPRPAGPLARLPCRAAGQLAHRLAPSGRARLHGAGGAAAHTRRYRGRECMAGLSTRRGTLHTGRNRLLLSSSRVRKRPASPGHASMTKRLFSLRGLRRTLALALLCTSAAAAAPSADEQIETGRYLAVAANCAGCHTAAGGEPYAGGTPLSTDFGVFYGPNITPSQSHGIGAWTADDFWQALHHGVAPDGSALYPAFPYPQYTQLTRADSDALYAYLMSQPAVDQSNTPHALRFPYDQRWLLSVWRALYFKPGGLEP